MESVRGEVCRPGGVRLPCIITHPAGAPAQNLPVVVLVHGLLSHMDHNFAPALCEHLTKAGLSSMRFTLRSSIASSDCRQRFCSFQEDTDDLLVAVEHVRAAGHRVVAIFGHSRGANVVLMAGSLPPLAGLPLVAVAPRFTMPEMLTKLFTPEQLATVEGGGSFVWVTKVGNMTVTPEDAAYTRGLDMAAEIGKLAATRNRVLLVHGTADDRIPARDAQLFADAAAAAQVPLQLQLVDGANHTFSSKPHTRVLLYETGKWIADACDIEDSVKAALKTGGGAQIAVASPVATPTANNRGSGGGGGGGSAKAAKKEKAGAGAGSSGSGSDAKQGKQEGGSKGQPAAALSPAAPAAASTAVSEAAFDLLLASLVE